MDLQRADRGGRLRAAESDQPHRHGLAVGVGDPGKVRTWLSPPTALGMVVGGIGDWMGFEVTDTVVAIVRSSAS